MPPVAASYHLRVYPEAGVTKVAISNSVLTEVGHSVRAGAIVGADGLVSAIVTPTLSVSQEALDLLTV